MYSHRPGVQRKRRLDEVSLSPDEPTRRNVLWDFDPNDSLELSWSDASRSERTLLSSNLDPSAKFPILTLPNELKLQVLNKLDPSESLDLMQINRLFRQLILQQGVFNESVEAVVARPDERSLTITKHSTPIELDPVKYGGLLTGLRRIRHLSIEPGWGDSCAVYHARVLVQIEEIDSLSLDLSASKIRSMKVYLGAIKAKIKHRADLKIVEDAEYFYRFLTNQLADCRELKMTRVPPRSVRHHWNLSNTRIEMMELSFHMALEIIRFGIPSRHPDAGVACRLVKAFYLPSQCMGLKELEALDELEDRGEIEKVLDEVDKSKMKAMALETLIGFDSGLWLEFRCPLDDLHCYRRQVDEKRQIVYLIASIDAQTPTFFAKYVPHF